MNRPPPWEVPDLLVYINMIICLLPLLARLRRSLWLYWVGIGFNMMLIYLFVGAQNLNQALWSTALVLSWAIQMWFHRAFTRNRKG